MLIAEHHLAVSDISVVSSWLNPVPMVVHRSSRCTEFGSLTLAITLILVARLFRLGLVGDVVVATVCSVSISWFAFRTYYDVKFPRTERIVLIPPTADDDTLLHELLHVHLGHIKRMSTVARILAISPVGPVEYGFRALRHDYGGEGVVEELHDRTKAKSHYLLVSPGLVTFLSMTLILFMPLVSII